MKLSFQQKALVLVAILGVGAVAVDRLVLSNGVSGPDSASATSATTPANPNQSGLASTTVGSPNDDPDKANQPATPGQSSGPTNHAALSHRLDQLAADKHLDMSDPPNAFALPATWNARESKRASSSDQNLADNAKSDQRLGSSSSQGQALRLEAVLVDDQGRSVAIVGGRTLHVGDHLGAYTVMRIGPRSATFANANRMVKLKLSDQ